MYQALYRKWRPPTFDEVYGQPHVTQTLKNELKSGRISHAYLFTGSRGTGKTSCAKILSKAVNCLEPEDGNPCGRCEICRGIDDGSILDIIEIDAASNNGVDNIRDIREEVNYTPAVCKYRVYIIDEVHMLSPGAFNALLKTLEEPPSHVIFILATTEIHKLPATILSRCQRFDFKRISPENISARLLQIAEGEKIELTPEAANLIARIADGGMRDAVSLLDRCCAGSEKIDVDVVSNSAGIAGTRHLFSFSEYIADNNFSASLELVNRLNSEACDIESLCTELMVHFRNLMIAKTVRDPSSLIICPPVELEELKKRSSQYKLSKILSCLEILENTAAAIKTASNKKIQLEAAVIKMCSVKGSTAAEPEENDVISSLVSRIESLERRLSGAAPLPQTPPAPTPVEEVRQKAAAETPPPLTPAEECEPFVPEEPEPEFSPPPAQPEPSTEPTPAPAQREFTAWPEVLEQLKKYDLPLLALLNSTSAFVSKGTHLVIRTENPLLFQFIASESHSVALRKAVYEVTGEKLKLAVKESNPQQQHTANPLEEMKRKVADFNSDNN